MIQREENPPGGGGFFFSIFRFVSYRAPQPVFVGLIMGPVVIGAFGGSVGGRSESSAYSLFMPSAVGATGGESNDSSLNEVHMLTALVMMLAIPPAAPRMVASPAPMENTVMTIAIAATIRPINTSRTVHAIFVASVASVVVF